MGYYSVTEDRWRSFLGISTDDIPETLIIQGEIDYPRYLEKRAQVLEDVRPAWMPNLVVGKHEGRTIAYGVCFGGPIASQFAHIYCKLGTRKVVVIGICGGLQADIELGDVVVSERVISLDGSARLYKHAWRQVDFDPTLCAVAKEELEKRAARVHAGQTVSYYDILLEEEDDLRDLSELGYIGIDMEAAAVGAVARHFETPAMSMHVVADNPISGKDLFYEQTEEERGRIAEWLDVIFEVALSL
jgi:purine-nucleoside phosphorylase